MATIKPLQGLRFNTDALEALTAPPYDVIDAQGRAHLAAKSDTNIVHLDLPEGEGDSKYTNAAELMNQWIEEQTLTWDDEPVFIAYAQRFTVPDSDQVISRKGFFALVKTHDYEDKVVLPHERTLSGPKADRLKLFMATKAALSPVFLLFDKAKQNITPTLEACEHWTNFKTEDHVEHFVGLIRDPKHIETIQSALKDSQLLIADGHHRYETTLEYGKSVDAQRSQEGLPAIEDGPHHYVMAFLADANDPDLLVLPTHRLVHNIADFDEETLRQNLGEYFEFQNISALSRQATQDALELAGKDTTAFIWQEANGNKSLLTLRYDFKASAHPVLSQEPEVLHTSDVAILHSVILDGMLGIDKDKLAAKTHVKYKKSFAKAFDAMDAAEGQALFLMNGTPVKEVLDVCKAGAFMPQKSTFFYPKVLTGISIHILDPKLNKAWNT